MTPFYPSSPDGTKTCKRGHPYHGSLGQCPECKAKNRIAWEARNRVSIHEYQLRYYQKTKKDQLEKRKTPEYKIVNNARRMKRWSENSGNVRDKHIAYLKAHPEKRIWMGMIRRCSSPKSNDYKYYGERGISVCDRWGDFRNFLQDMGRRPSPIHSIERIDNNEGYNPENCVWATPSQQNRNTRRNRYLEFGGKRQCLTDWAKDLGISSSLLSTRLNALKWPLERALTTGPYIRS